MTDVDLAKLRENVARAYAFGRHDERANPSGFVHPQEFAAAVGTNDVGTYAGTYQRLSRELNPQQLTVHRRQVSGLKVRQIRVHGYDSVAIAGQVLSASEADLVSRAISDLARQAATHNTRGTA